MITRKSLMVTSSPFSFPTLLLFIAVLLIPGLKSQAQWLDWQDETATRLVLTSVANSDDEEKDQWPADLNKDGFMDLVVVRKEPFSNSTEPPKSDLLLMNVNGVLTDQTDLYAPEFISAPTFARDVFIGDFDGDTWPDVIVANTFNMQPKFYRNLGNDGNGNWLGLEDQSYRFPNLTGDTILFCAVWGGDVTGDGAMDIYFVNYKVNSGGGTAKDFLLINDGTGFFTDESASRLGNLRNSAFGTAVQIRDIDNDGDQDVIKISTLYNVSPWNARGTIILFNSGAGFFTNWQNLTPTTSPYMFDIADFNNDGKLDFYVVDDGSDKLIIVNTINANTSLTFTSTNVTFGSVSGFGGNVHAADIDLDGDMDIGVSDVDVDIPPCNSSRRFAILENVGGSFANPYGNTAYDWVENSYDFSWIDINNDGLLDFVNGGCSGYGLFMSNNCELAPNQADTDGDGITDACDPCPTIADPNCIPPIEYPVVSTEYNIARQWNEMLLESIRRDFARPTIHARNLFHVSAAMWDAWSAYEPGTCPFLLGQTVGGFSCAFTGIPAPADVAAARDTAITYAAYRILSERFANSPNPALLQQGYDVHMDSLGMDPNFTSVDYSTGSAAALGNYIGQCYINFGLQDGSNEANGYANQSYSPVNPPLNVDIPGNPNIVDYNRWQPLTLALFIDQSGNEIPGSTPPFLSPEWGSVVPFSMDNDDVTLYNRDGFDYPVYHDKGAPPHLSLDGSGDTELYRWSFETTAIWSSHLDPTDGVMWDISPATLGDRSNLPASFGDHPTFYDQLNGGTVNNGHPINPATGLPYAPNIVPRGDYARVLAEFWADGPQSETPPGHWFTIFNYVSDHPAETKQFKGVGAPLDDMEWDVKGYFALGGAMHDVAVCVWGHKGWYDFIRPMSAIRAMADLGQCSDPGELSYHPAGLHIIPGYIEVVHSGDALAGAGDENVGKIKMKAWRGHNFINNVDTDEAGVDWILAEDWEPYQRPSFVTPPFAGYMSGHSTYSRAAAEVLTIMTGDEYFPGGMGVFVAPQDEFLVFEDGPSIDIELQWATYRDAADESAASRIWGGIHPTIDDIPGRELGIVIGVEAFNYAEKYFTDNDNDGLCNAFDPIPGCTDPDACNYDAIATEDNGSCTFPGCTDPLACNYDAAAGCTDGSCIPAGCTNAVACNYDAAAGCDDGSCTLPGCTNPAACNYDAAAGCDDGSCTFPGCTNAAACNYSATAGCDDGSCTFPGCTNAAACNYNAAAGCDDGSCTLPGCTNIAACNYNATAGCDDGSCTLPGCTDAAACNYDATAGCDDGSCEYVTCAGCTDNTACNYNAAATIDDGSCTYGGCTDLGACNFNPSAGCDDGSCDYSCGSCFGDFDGNGVINTSDLLLLMAQFGCSSGCGPYDLDGNGVVNTSDLLLFMAIFGTVCP